jgi:hypothetical protein
MALFKGNFFVLPSDPEELIQFYRDNRKRGKLVVDNSWPLGWIISHQNYSYFIFDIPVAGGGRPLFNKFTIIDSLKPTQIWAF